MVNYSGGLPAGWYSVKSYGAKGDGVTDDTAAINKAVTAAVTAATASGSNYAVVFFPPGVYQLGGATTKTTTNKGNAQIPLPVVSPAGQKFIIAFVGGYGAPLPHFSQTSVQKAGAVLNCTLTGQTVDGTFGPPSVIGGPTPAQGYGQGTNLYNNVQVIVDGINIVLPSDPTLVGMDFSGCAQMDIRSASVNASTVPGSATPTLPTHSWATGLYAPQRGNNDSSQVRDYSCEGMYLGMILSEHAVVHKAQIIYGVVGIDILTSIDYVAINYASVELCQQSLQCEALGTGLGKVRVHCLDIEDDGVGGTFAPGNHVNDAGNLLRGEIVLHRFSASAGNDAVPIVNGGTGVRIINGSQIPGAATAPGIPATTVAIVNPFWRDADVRVNGGTVSAITVDGVATGGTAGSVVVPSGKTIALTYTVAPTWTWYLL